MAKQNINVGTTANDKKGDSLRAAFQKVNANFTELYTALGLTDTVLNLGAFTFTGSTLSTDDSTDITIDKPITVNGEITVDGDIVPKTNLGSSLGTPTRQFKSLYVSTNTIYINNVPLSLDGSNNILVNNTPISTAIEYTSIPNAPTDVADLTDLTGLLSGGGSSDRLINGSNEAVLEADGSITLPTTSRLNFGQPTLRDRSDNSKNELITLYDFDTPGTTNYGIGVKNNTIWMSTDSDAAGFAWYGGEFNTALELSGTGQLTISGNIVRGDSKLDLNGGVNLTPVTDNTVALFMTYSTATLKGKDGVTASTRRSVLSRTAINQGTGNHIIVVDTAIWPTFTAVNSSWQLIISGNPTPMPISTIIVVGSVWTVTMANNMLEIANGAYVTFSEQAVWNDWEFGSDGTLNLPESTSTGNAIIQSTNSIQLNANGKTWSFAVDGNLTLPAGGDILDSTGTSVLGGGSSLPSNASGALVNDGAGVLTWTPFPTEQHHGTINEMYWVVSTYFIASVNTGANSFTVIGNAVTDVTELNRINIDTLGVNYALPYLGTPSYDSVVNRTTIVVDDFDGDTVSPSWVGHYLRCVDRRYQPGLIGFSEGFTLENDNLLKPKPTSVTTVAVTDMTHLTHDQEVIFCDPASAGGNVDLYLPDAPPEGKTYTIKNISAGNTLVGTLGPTVYMETEFGIYDTGTYATINANNAAITWIFSNNGYRIIHRHGI